MSAPARIEWAAQRVIEAQDVALADEWFTDFITRLEADSLRVRRAASEPHRPLPPSVHRAHTFDVETERLRTYLRSVQDHLDHARRTHATHT